MVGTRGDIPDGRRGRRPWRGGVATAVVAAWGLWPGLAAAATTAGVTLQYTCAVGAPMTARVAWQAPRRIMVGKSTPAVRITAAATIIATNRALFEFVGAASMDGTGDAAGVIVAPQGDVDTALRLVVARTPVPASGQMTFHAVGALSVPVFGRPGRAEVDVGTTLDLTLIPRDGKGSPILGPVVEPCALNPGQDRELFSFGIESAPAVTPSPITTGVTLPPTPAAAGPPSRGSSGPGTASTADPSVSSSAPTTTPTPAPTTATSAPAGDSAAALKRRRRPTDWWWPMAGTLAVVGGAVGGVRCLRDRRRPLTTRAR